MSNVINIWEWKRARLGRNTQMPIRRRARPTRRPESGSDGAFLRIGEVSNRLLERLRRE